MFIFKFHPHLQVQNCTQKTIHLYQPVFCDQLMVTFSKNFWQPDKSKKFKLVPRWYEKQCKKQARIM